MKMIITVELEGLDEQIQAILDEVAAQLNKKKGVTAKVQQGTVVTGDTQHEDDKETPEEAKPGRKKRASKKRASRKTAAPPVADDTEVGQTPDTEKESEQEAEGDDEDGLVNALRDACKSYIRDFGLEAMRDTFRSHGGDMRLSEVPEENRTALLDEMQRKLEEFAAANDVEGALA